MVFGGGTRTRRVEEVIRTGLGGSWEGRAKPEKGRSIHKSIERSPKEESEERRAKRGDQAYAPFGAGRETGHQVPVVAAKIESDR